MDEIDRDILKEVQDGIPLVKRPYEEVASRLDLEEEEVLTRLEKLKDEGVYRRFGASLNHRKIGFKANAMVVWDIEEERVDEAGNIASAFEEVTHCYRRPKKEGKWDYSLYTMIHSDSKEKCEKIAEKIADSIGVEEEDYQAVYSTRELKKTGVRI